MSEQLLTEPCVRVSIIVNGEKISHGSGTMVRGTDGFFIITAYHCVHFGGSVAENLDLSTVLVERQASFNSPFKKMECTQLVAFDGRADWTLLKVNYDDVDSSYPDILVCNNFKAETPIDFMGFQDINQDQARPFKGRVLNATSNNEFRITLSGQDRFKAGVDDAKGLSGSGAFIINDGKLYLAGILKSVHGDEASNNDVKCCPMVEIAKKIGIDAFDISTETFGDGWGGEQFGTIEVTDSRNLIDKIRAVNNSMSERRIQRYCRDLALGKSELSNIDQRDLSAIKYRVFEECQTELIEFLDQHEDGQLSNDAIAEMIGRFTDRAIEIIKVKSKSYRYPVIDDDLMQKIVLDLINECYLSFDEEGIYAE